MYRMLNPIREYAWGSPTAMAEMFGWPTSSTPQAEMWMGAHPASPSSVISEATIPLDDFLERYPESLGEHAELPFLLKVLAAQKPLSIQAHPSPDIAAAGYAAENDAGLPLDAPERTYRDPRHKPELVVALSDFSALCGFRPYRDSKADLRVLREALAETEQRARTASRDTDSLRPLEVFDILLGFVAKEDYPGALNYILRNRHDECSRAASAVNSLISGRAQKQTAPPEGNVPAQPSLDLPSPTIDTLTQVTQSFPGDPGILVTLLMNREDLAPGEALYLPAGNLHAYLYGVGVEVMANSDNVLRGGLTNKHIDIDQLLAVTRCDVLPIPHCAAELSGPGRYNYRPPFEEFQLQRIEFPEAQGAVNLRPEGPAILLCTAGELRVQSDAENSGGFPGETDVTMPAGESVFLPAGHPSITISHTAGDRAQAFLTRPGEPQQH